MHQINNKNCHNIRQIILISNKIAIIMPNPSIINQIIKISGSKMETDR